MSIDAKSSQYGWFYATFGFGALFGAAMVGTVLLQAARSLLISCHVLALVSPWRGLPFFAPLNRLFRYFLCWFLLFNPPYDLEHILAGAR